jgi:DNA-directed RNA polymerase subunit RPC12/RpoP
MKSTWADTPIQYIPVPKCPYCGSRDRLLIRSKDQGDGSQLRQYVCSGCSQRYRIVADPSLPIIGNDGFAYS